MDSENSEASKSPNHFIDIESHNMPLALHPNSAALRSWITPLVSELDISFVCWYDNDACKS